MSKDVQKAIYLLSEQLGPARSLVMANHTIQRVRLLRLLVPSTQRPRWPILFEKSPPTWTPNQEADLL